MILVDSSVWIDYFNGVRARETDLLDRLLGVEPLCIGDLILVEVLQGFRTDDDCRRAQALLQPLECHCIGGREVALAAARSCRSLRSRGVTVRKTIDMLIGTCCMMPSCCIRIATSMPWSGIWDCAVVDADGRQPV